MNFFCAQMEETVKKEVTNVINIIGLENFFNLLLVRKKIRPAMLIQPSCYNERSGKDPKMKQMLDVIQNEFPELMQSDDYEMYQGTIISYQNFNGKKISMQKMGEILGYPCFADYDPKRKENHNFVININVCYKEIRTYSNNTITLLTNVSKDTLKIREFEIISEKAEKELKQFQHLFDGIEILKVEVHVEELMSVKSIINKLIINDPLNKKEKDEIVNILYNCGFEVDIQYEFMNQFQYDNLIHKGMLLQLLIHFENNPLEPFFPLYQYPEKDTLVNSISQKWGANFIDVLEKTKV